VKCVLSISRMLGQNSFAHSHLGWFYFCQRESRLTSTTQQVPDWLPSPERCYVVLAVVVGIWLTWDALIFQLVTYSPHADYWEHTALLTAWLRDLANPGNPHVLDDSLSPRYMPWFFVLTVIGQWFGLDSVQLMGISAVVSYVLIVIGIQLFFREYFQDRWAPTVAFLVLFLAWGVSWNWSNLYQLRSFFYVAGYPSSFVFGLSLISFWYTMRVLNGQVSLLKGAPVLLVLAALMFLCHPLTGVFGIFGCGLLAITVAADSLKTRAVVCVALLLGSFAVELWPYFSVWEVTLGSSGNDETSWAAADQMTAMERLRSGVWLHIFYRPWFLIIMLGFGWLCIAAWFYLLAERRDPFILLGGAAMMFPYFAHMLISVPLAHRFLLFAMFFFHMAGIRVLLDFMQSYFSANEESAKRMQPIAVGLTALVAIAALFNVLLLAGDFTGKHLSPRLEVKDKFAQLPIDGTTVDLYKILLVGVGPEDVVIAPPEVAWPLPTVTGKAVSLYHENPMLTDQMQRAADVGTFFTMGTDAATREAILEQYDVSWVLIDGSDVPQAFTDWVQSIGEQTAEVGTYRMYRLNDI